MMRTICFFIMTILCQSVVAQDSIPLLTGKVILSVEKGTMDCDFTLSNIPRIGDYVIRINSGMNIRNFKNPANGKRIYYEFSMSDTLSSGETKAYYFSGNDGVGKFLPKSIRFRYAGMFPVVKDTTDDYCVQDWKGNIAFNGYSVRVDGRQSGWYPVLYDIKKDVVYHNLKYDVEVSCADCNVIYINGSLPVKDTIAHVTSELPRELTMFAGRFKTANVNNTYFLNPDINDEQIKVFGDMTNNYKKFYEQHLKIPYKDNITYIQTTPVSKDNAWLFVSYPSIFNIGWGKFGMKGFFDEQEGNWFKPYIAHELGHYYFGTYKVFNAELGDMMSEGFSEYLSMKITKSLISDSIYRKKMAEKVKGLSDFAAVSFKNVRSASDYKKRDLYVYYYAPVIFTAIEKEIGEEKMWQWLTKILQTNTAFTNYDFMKQTLSEVISDKEKLAMIESKYFESDKSVVNAIATIGKF